MQFNDTRIKVMAVNEVGAVWNTCNNDFNSILGKDPVDFNGYPEDAAIRLFESYMPYYNSEDDKNNNSNEYRMAKMLVDAYKHIVEVEKKWETAKRVYSKRHFHQY